MNVKRELKISIILIIWDNKDQTCIYSLSLFFANYKKQFTKQTSFIIL